MAIQENAIILTCDRDFIQMKKELKKRLRVIYFYLDIPNYENLINILSEDLTTFIEYLRTPGAIEVNEKGIEYISVE